VAADCGGQLGQHVHHRHDEHAAGDDRYAGGFPLYNAQQDCLDEPGNGASCLKTNQTNTDAFIAEISPTSPGANPLYSTYVGAATPIRQRHRGGHQRQRLCHRFDLFADWVCNCGVPFQTAYGGDGDAYIVKIESVSLASGGINTLQYFTYLGGSGADVGNAIQVDAVQTRTWRARPVPRIFR